MFRDDLKTLSRIRRREALVLLRGRHFAGAYYLSGLAVECALKACIAKESKQFEFPDKKHAIDCFTHDLTVLLKKAGLESDLALESTRSPAFGVNWATIKDWKVESRYEHAIAPLVSQSMYSAAVSRNGVLQWL